MSIDAPVEVCGSGGSASPSVDVRSFVSGSWSLADGAPGGAEFATIYLDAYQPLPCKYMISVHMRGTWNPPPLELGWPWPPSDIEAIVLGGVFTSQYFTLRLGAVAGDDISFDYTFELDISIWAWIILTGRPDPTGYTSTGKVRVPVFGLSPAGSASAWFRGSVSVQATAEASAGSSRCGRRPSSCVTVRDLPPTWTQRIDFGHFDPAHGWQHTTDPADSLVDGSYDNANGAIYLPSNSVAVPSAGNPYYRRFGWSYRGRITTRAFGETWSPPPDSFDVGITYPGEPGDTPQNSWETCGVPAYYGSPTPPHMLVPSTSRVIHTVRHDTGGWDAVTLEWSRSGVLDLTSYVPSGYFLTLRLLLQCGVYGWVMTGDGPWIVGGWSEFKVWVES